MKEPVDTVLVAFALLEREMTMLRVVINRAPYELPDGGSVLDALRAVGVRVPAMCHDERLVPSGACRLCLARIDDVDKPVAACTTPLSEGMHIQMDTTRIEPDGPTLRESSCVSCGACVDTCPTGALEDRAASSLDAPAEWTRTTCPYCGVGCEMHVGTHRGRIVAIRPVLDAPVSKGHLCVKGRYAFDFVSARPIASRSR